MKKKYAWGLLTLVTVGYAYFSLYFFFSLDVRIKRSIERGSHMPVENRMDEIMDSLVNTHCKCEDWAAKQMSNILLRTTPASKYKKFQIVEPPLARQCPVSQQANFSRLGSQSREEKNPLVNMFEVYRDFHLTYPKYVWTHTGWTDQWDLTYSATQWAEEKLQVHVVPFSHNDPGWLSTYRYYFSTKTLVILNAALQYMREDPSATFLWAETVFLRDWYEAKKDEDKLHFRELLKTGRFEIVTGGWVMTDEAVAHYPAMLDQLIEGHLWLKKTFNYTVETAWAMDPFGHSATMAYILQRTGFKNSLIQRTHYAVKKYLGYNKQLQFYWQQAWDKPQTPGIFTHMLPFLSYSITHSCGPDIQVCCQLDFRSSKCWAWGKYQEPEAISDSNVDEKARALLDQFRKTAQLYQHNVLLFQYGDDFRLTSTNQWKHAIRNLTTLFDFMNNQQDMRIEVKFSTLSQYFDAVHKNMKTRQQTFPSLVGDFHTYSDRDDQYWSGYFTSRPFLKTRTRLLQSRLRAAEILNTLCLVTVLKAGPSAEVSTKLTQQMEALSTARQTSGLLQHHDAITGTAKAKVVRDYLESLYKALDNVQEILETCISLLLQKQPATSSDKTVKLLDVAKSQNSLTELEIIPVTDGLDQTVVIYNPLPTTRQEVVKVHISSSDVALYDGENSLIQECQVNPVWVKYTRISLDEFELAFLVSIPPLSLRKFILRPATGRDRCPLSTVTVYSPQRDRGMRSPFAVSWVGRTDFLIQSSQLRAYFCSCTGLLQGVQNKTSGASQQTNMQFVSYGTGQWSNPIKDKSGAYVFLPDGNAKNYIYERYTAIRVEGPVMASVTTALPLVTQEVTLYNTSGVQGKGIHIENLVDIRGQSNFELGMRLTTLTDTGPYFFTDLNGFQVHRRETMSKFGIQGNFYPVTSLAYVDNGRQRVSLHSAQSHGVASLEPGQIEVMLDRLLDQDDWRGLGEGVQDNLPTVSKFVLLLENREHPQKSIYDKDVGFPSLLSHTVSDALNNPLILLHQKINTPLTGLQLLNAPWPCDLRFLNLRFLDKHGWKVTALLIVHKLGLDCDLVSYKCDDSSDMLQWLNLFSTVEISEVEEMNLSGARSKSTITDTYLPVSPMEIQTYKLTLR